MTQLQLLRRMALAVFAASCLSLTTAAAPAPVKAQVKVAKHRKGRYFVAVKVTGTVFSRAPNSYKWQTVEKNKRLAEGDIVQTLPGSLLSLRAKGGIRGSELSGQQTVLTVTSPMILRLETSMLRPVALDRMFLHDMPQTAAKAAPKGPVLFGLSEAWHRVAAILTGKKQSGEGATQEQNQSVSLAVSAKHLILLTPQANAVFSGSPLPVESKIVWLPVGEPDIQYYIYVWPSESAIDSPVAVTRQEFHTHLFAHYGTYNVQVTSRDGRWQSAVTVVHIVPAAFQNAATKLREEAVKTLAGAAPEPPVALLYPPKNLLVVQTETGTAVDFYWRPVGTTPAIYELKVMNEAKRVIAQKRTRAVHLGLKLDLGSYAWTVSSFPLSSKPGVKTPAMATSAPRQLEVTRSTPGQPLQSMIYGLLRNGTRGSVYLSRGL